MPWFELAWVRPLFGAARALMPDPWAKRWFESEAARIAALARGLGPERGARRVLVPRLAGLEDSSRYWSAYMTLEHLCIVNEGVIRIIQALGEGRPYGVEVKIEDVKPSPSAGPEMLERFEGLAARYFPSVEKAIRSPSRLRHAHPWFGGLDARGWHCFAPIHHGLHRRQLEAIVRGCD